ncbi:hypothetical protein P3TCK_11008 [Photobacterium profundum 3TCK]|uniref:Uncharacterized protein n=2 Tax=Photobacterium profundum TaxID=74109 RepID=Q1Z6E0_9GAMM|nr:hypothetical protein P3TCK_11008 [Photobacterium profundum 3TCK]
MIGQLMTKNTPHIVVKTVAFQHCPAAYEEMLNMINSVSRKLATDVYLIVLRSLGYEDGWAYEKSITLKHLRIFAYNLPTLVVKLGNDTAPLLEQGLQALYLERGYWMKIEECTEAVAICKGIAWGRQPISQLSEAIQYLLRSFKDNPSLIAPSYIRLLDQGKVYTLAPLYQISSELMLECQSLMLRYARAHKRPELAIKKTNAAVSGLLTAAKNKQTKVGLLAEGLRYIASDFDNCIAALKACTSKQDKDGLVVLLRECDPSILGPNRYGLPTTAKSIHIEFAGITNDLKAVYLISPKMVLQAQEYLLRITERCKASEMGIAPKEFVYNFPSVGKRLFELQGQLDTEDRQLINDKGALAFLENEGKLLRWFWEMTQSLKDRNSEIRKEISIQPSIGKKSLVKSYIALAGLLSFLVGSKVRIQRYYPFYLEFTHEGDPTDARFYSIRYIYENYPALGHDLVKAKERMLGSMEHDGLANISVHSFFRNLKPIFEYCEELFTAQEKGTLATEGAKALSLNNHRIMKKCLERIQQRFKSGDIVSDTAHAQQKGLKDFSALFGFTWVDSFPIDAGRADLFSKQQKTDDYYTLDEATQLAFHIELILAKNNLSRLHQLWLRVARIILKTNWNMAPIFNLEVDDLFEVEFAGRRSYLVRLLKPRAGYKTQWNRFDTGAEVEMLLEEDVKVGQEVLAVIRDLQFIMDELSVDIRASLSDTHPFKKSLMIFNDGLHSNGRVKKLTEGGYKTGINDLLKVNGCPTPFSPTKIRKGGLNFIYRQVAKDFSKYKAVGNHSWKVFREHYFKFDGNATEETLSKAISVMGDYFHGRPIVEKIQIVTETQEYWQQTPNGKCASQGNDAQARAYNKTHHALFKMLGIEESQRCADFNACLWCEHYRGIADVEHGYRLLSYRDFVIADMESSIGESLNTGLQKEYVYLLRQRIDEVLADMDAINPGCHQAAKDYLDDHGIHPDWALASTTSMMQ